MTAEPASDRVRLRRKPDRGRHDRETIDAILDAALVGHVGWVLDGQPYVTPTAIWRAGDRLYWHGSAGGRLARAARAGTQVCVTASILDGFVLARSATDHSMNFRSVMVLGQARVVEGEAETLAALEAFVERYFPGRWAELRPATSKEVRATTVLWVDLAEASAKVRAEGVHEEPGDETWPAWAGVVPVARVAADAEPDEHVPEGMPVPGYLPRPGASLEGRAPAGQPAGGAADPR
jgi:uncharacterized protein